MEVTKPPSIQSKRNRMQVKTILNRVQKFKSFVYGAVCWVEGASVPTLEVEIQPRLNSRPVCSGCRRKRPGYDRLPERRFEFIPMWGNKVFFLYEPRRVECPTCGIRVESRRSGPMPESDRVDRASRKRSLIWYSSWRERMPRGVTTEYKAH